MGLPSRAPLGILRRLIDCGVSMTTTTLPLALAVLLLACASTKPETASGSESGESSTTEAPGVTTTATASSCGPVATSSGGTPTTGTTVTAGSETGSSATLESTDGTSTSVTSESSETTETGGHGLCGWNPDQSYYACEKDGGVPGTVDPMGEPIDCPPDVMAGADCTEDGPVNNFGCCTPEGVLYYCEIVEMNKVLEIDCGS